MAAVALLMTGCVSTIDGQPSLAGGGAADVEEVFEQVEAPEIGTWPDSDAWIDLITKDGSCLDYLLPNDYLGAREQDRLLVRSAPYLPKKLAWEAAARWLA